MRDCLDAHSELDNFLIDSVLDVVRMEAEGCDCLQDGSRFAWLLSYLVKFQLPSAAIQRLQWHLLEEKYKEVYGMTLDVKRHRDPLAAATTLLWDVIARIVAQR